MYLNADIDSDGPWQRAQSAWPRDLSFDHMYFLVAIRNASSLLEILRLRLV